MKKIHIEDSALKAIEGDRKRTFQAVEKPLSAEMILNDICKHDRKRVIIICNTVSHAQGLFKDFEKNNPKNLESILLHSRFFPEDRKQKEEELQRIFKRDWQDDDKWNDKSYVLISTQVIEVGINITSQVMHVYLCPMSSLLQRAGRCARFPGETGAVYVYQDIDIQSENRRLSEADLEEESTDSDESKSTKLRGKFLPYDDGICQETWKVLQAHTNSEKVHQSVGYRLEESWINQVHEKESKLQGQRRQNHKLEFEQRFEDAIFRGDRSAARDLIRLVDNRNIFVPEEELMNEGESEEIDLDSLEPFSLPVTTLRKIWKEFQKSGNTDWIFRGIESPPNKKAETYSRPVWRDIKSEKDLVSSIRILVNPNYAYYNAKIGLRITLDPTQENPEDRFTSRAKQRQSTINQYHYHMDTYAEHLGRLWIAWRKPFATTILNSGTSIKVESSSVRDELLSSGGSFIREKIFPEITKLYPDAGEAKHYTEALFEFLVFLAIFTHDLGKLQVGWQKVMRGWQVIAHKHFAGKDPEQHLLAHTDYNPAIPALKQRYDDYMKQNQRPTHAIESAFLACEILETTLCPVLEEHFQANEEQIGNLCSVILMAAGRHHSAWTNGWKLSDVEKIDKIVLDPKASQEIAQTWKNLVKFLPKTLSLPSELPPLSQSVYPAEVLKLNLFEPDQLEYQQLYTLVVRGLRLCDQRSVQLKK